MDTKEFRHCPFCGHPLLHPNEAPVGAPTCVKCQQPFYSSPHPTVAAVVLDEHEEHVLLARRRFDPFKGYWDIPGGFLDPGEALEDGLRREMQEELGIEIRIRCTLGSYPDTYGQEAIPTINVYYLVSIASGKPTPGTDVSEVRWFHRDNLPATIAFENVRQALDAWRRKHSLGRT